MEPISLTTKEDIVGLNEHDIESPTLEKDVSLGSTKAEVPASKDADYQEFLSLHQAFQSDAKRHRKLLWKLDLRLIPVFAFIYLLSFLDRSNIGNAKVAGLAAATHLTDYQYQTSVSLFYVFYVAFQMPSNVALKFVRPKLWIAFLTISWGLVVSLQSLVTTYQGLYAARIFLGITQSGLVAAIVIILNSWYSRRELGLRIGLFFASASLSGAFSGILAYALTRLDGDHGISGWQWIFIVEGVITIFFGLLCPFIVLDDIERCGSWLEPEEKRYLHLRSLYAHGPVTTAQSFKWIYLWRAICDWKIWCQMYILMVTNVIGQSIGFTLPVIFKALAFTTIESYLIPVPIYFGACIVLLINAWHSDRKQERFWHIQWVFALGIIAAAILIKYSGHNTGVTVFGLVILTFSGYGAVALCDAWNSNNIIGMKRRLGLPLSLGIGQFGAIVGAYSYKASEAPYYPTGYGVALGFAAGGFLIVCPAVRYLGYERLNKQRDRMTEEDIRAKYTDQQLADMFDDSPLFRYSL